jgi:hypothetical protein
MNVTLRSIGLMAWAAACGFAQSPVVAPPKFEVAAIKLCKDGGNSWSGCF